MKPRTSDALVNATTAIESLMNAVQKDTLRAVIDELTDKIECYSQLMVNGRMIMETLYGDRFNKMHEKRMECWSFIAGLQSAQSLLISKL